MVVKTYMKFIKRWKEEAELLQKNNKGTTKSAALFTAALIAIIVGLALLPVVRDFANDSKSGANDSTDKLIDLIPLFWVLAVLGVTVALTVVAFRMK